jgi:hypothetical protein
MAGHPQVTGQEPEGLTPGPETQQLTQNADYDELVELDPAFGPVAGNEEPNEEEQAHYDMLYADFMDELFGAQSKNAETMLRTGPELFKSVATVAFNILHAVHQRHEQRDGPVPQAALFGEGGMISTAVDEVFQMAIALQLPDSQDQDQYTAAQMDVMRQVGDYLEKSQDDGAVNESQDLLLDMETADGTVDNTPPLDAREQADLAAIGETGTVPPQRRDSAYDQAAAEAGQNQQQQEVPPQPPQQGLV